MAKGNRKRFNKSARDQTITTVVKADKRVVSAISNGGVDDVDDSNALVLEKKQVTVKRAPVLKPTLSKRRRKHLEKLIEQKEKKLKRGELLEKLSELRVPSSELARYHSIAHIGNKQQHEKSVQLAKRPDREVIQYEKLNAIKGAKRRKIEESPEDSESSDVSTDEEENTVETKPVKEAPEDEIKSEKASAQLDNPEEKVPTKPKLNDSKLDFVLINRPTEIQESRLALPILSDEGTVLEAVSQNDFVVLCGETGSGKTTQVPQFLYEAGFCSRGMIGMTEPRRIAATSAASRIRYEMCKEEPNVAHHIRYENKTTSNTEISVMTDGVLLSQMSSDFLLTKFSVIIIDEAHERSIHTDVLIGMLTRVVTLRRKRNKPLKLIIMSATLRIDDFVGNKKLFPKDPPPVLKIESRQYPVSTSFAKQTELRDYIAAAYRKVCRIHREEPAGSILVFVTGQDEVKRLVKMLSETFPNEAIEEEKSKDLDLDKFEAEPAHKISTADHDEENLHLEEDDDEYGECDFFDDELDKFDISTTALDKTLPMVALPLYSVLPPGEQKMIFNEFAEPIRKVVVATNVAETSLTIPGIKYVVDTGRHKAKKFSSVTGVSKFEIEWISQAAADQRAGRAGRTGPGRCFRLYSSAVFQDFASFPPPEITMKPLDDLVLGMKAFGIDEIKNFPFVTLPDPESLVKAEKLCINLGALKRPTRRQMSGGITALGKTMNTFPVSPRFGRILSLSAQQNLLKFTISIVSACTVRELVDVDNDKIKSLKDIWADGTKAQLGDLLILLSIIGATESSKEPEKFIGAIGVRSQGLRELRKLRRLITHVVRPLLSDENEKELVERRLPPPSVKECNLLCELFLAGFGDHIAFHVGEGEYKLETGEKAMVYPSSVLVKRRPPIICYQEKIENQKGNIYMKCCHQVTNEQIVRLVPEYCTFTRTKMESPKYDSESGNIVALYKSTYTSTNMPLGDHWKPLFGEDETLLRCFSHSLLSGEVFPEFKRLSSLWLSPPAVLLRTWANLHERTTNLIKCFSIQGLISRSTFLEKMKSSHVRNEVQESLREWVLPSQFCQLESILEGVLSDSTQ